MVWVWLVVLVFLIVEDRWLCMVLVDRKIFVVMVVVGCLLDVRCSICCLWLFSGLVLLNRLLVVRIGLSICSFVCMWCIVLVSCLVGVFFMRKLLVLVFRVVCRYLGCVKVVMISICVFGFVVWIWWVVLMLFVFGIWMFIRYMFGCSFFV